MSETLKESAVRIETVLRHQAAMAAFGSFAFRETDLPTILDKAVRICANAVIVPFCKVYRYRSKENDLLMEAGKAPATASEECDLRSHSIERSEPCFTMR